MHPTVSFEPNLHHQGDSRYDDWKLCQAEIGTLGTCNVVASCTNLRVPRPDECTIEGELVVRSKRRIIVEAQDVEVELLFKPKVVVAGYFFVIERFL